MLQEFKSFLTKTNALALAIGVIIGAATGKVVSAIVDDLLMPVIGLVLPSGGDWREASITLLGTQNTIRYGHLIGTLVDFVIIAFVVFLITKALLKPGPAPAEPATRACPECLEVVPQAARRCRACGSALSPVTEGTRAEV